MSGPQAIVFDLDGVLIETEEVWDDVRRAYVAQHGGRYTERAQRAIMGMSSPEWSRYLREELGVPRPPETINDEVVALMEARYRERLPLLDGAVEAVERMAAELPLAIASSANRPLIDLVLDLSGLGRHFRATVSSEEVPRGKPAPDVYLEAARRLGVDPSRCAAVEDSHNGLRSAHAAGMLVVAIPNRAFPPDDEALALADIVVPSLAELSPSIFSR